MSWQRVKTILGHKFGHINLAAQPTTTESQLVIQPPRSVRPMAVPKTGSSQSGEGFSVSETRGNPRILRVYRGGQLDQQKILAQILAQVLANGVAIGGT